MGDIVYWGNGDQTLGEYSAPKDVAIAERNCESSLSWDSGQVSGQNATYSLKEPCIKASFISNCVPNRQNTNTWNYVFMSQTLGRWLNSSDVLGTVGLSGSCFQSSPYGLIVNGVNYGRNGNDYVKFFSTYGNGDPFTDGDGDPYIGGQKHSSLSPTRGGVSLSLIEGKIIISGADDPSEDGEFNLIDPSSIQSEDIKAIAITYSDGTSEELPLNTCPEWVRIRSDEECPEDTCRVECEDHYCCYGCDGKPVLEIPK